MLVRSRCNNAENRTGGYIYNSFAVGILYHVVHESRLYYCHWVCSGCILALSMCSGVFGHVCVSTALFQTHLLIEDRKKEKKEYENTTLLVATIKFTDIT